MDIRKLILASEQHPLRSNILIIKTLVGQFNQIKNKSAQDLEDLSSLNTLLENSSPKGVFFAAGAAASEDSSDDKISELQSKDDSMCVCDR